MLDGDVGLLGSAACSDTPVAGAEVGAGVLGACHGGGAESTLQVGVAWACSARFDLARGLVVARGGSGPRRQMTCGGKAGHVRTSLGDDDVGGQGADARDGADQVAKPMKGRDRRL